MVDIADEIESRAVVVHVPLGDALESVLRNVGNLRAELGDASPIEVVCHGPGLDLLLAAGPHRPAVEALLGRRVVFDACGNTMARVGVTPEQLTPGTRIVPAGLAQVARLQWAGSAYVRP